MKYERKNVEIKTKKINKKILTRFFEIFLVICMVVSNYIYVMDAFSLIDYILIPITVIVTIALIVGLEKGNKIIKKICVIIGVICSLICIVYSVYATMIDSHQQDYPADFVVYKPIIYLYPEEETEVSVELGYPENITVSYPKYETGWKVLAKTDGTLTDLITGRSLYSLYYESTNKYNFEVTSEGFIVKGEDTAEFLEEKLEILGLNERESEEFIIYWLPVLQENEYNYIRFATTEEIEENMPLIINPNPDTVIRVLMTYKGLDNSIEVEEQELETPERTGFVAVEWGGTKIN